MQEADHNCNTAELVWEQLYKKLVFLKKTRPRLIGRGRVLPDRLNFTGEELRVKTLLLQFSPMPANKR